MARAIYTVSAGESRGFTNALMEAAEDGVITSDMLLRELLLWMSESEVADFCERSLALRDEDNKPVIRHEDDDEDEDEDN